MPYYIVTLSSTTRKIITHSNDPSAMVIKFGENLLDYHIISLENVKKMLLIEKRNKK